VNVWVEAARPRTLTAAVVPVAVGTASADRFIAWRALAALLVSLAIQISVNYANDLFDAQRGIDTEERVGPRRATATGLVTPGQMKSAMVLALGVAAVAGGALAITVGPELWLVGLACVLALIGYSGGPKPYASLGLGEVFVFVFFGLVATVGSAYVHTERIEAESVIASIPVGLLAVAILIVNNLRDVETDAAAGKRTLAVRIGATTTRGLYAATILIPFMLLVAVAGIADSQWPLLAALSAPLAIAAVRRTRGTSGRELLPALGATARLQLAYGLLLALGLWIAR
jgi:1,4-dihydroxy-2-naphthoate octaprenyltransferase